jgi:hypothetical protein
MASQCRAKDPNSCRVHGSGGMMERLTAMNEEAFRDNDVMLYVQTKDQIEALSEDSDTPSFIAPDRGELLVDNWTNKHGEIIPEAPNDMLLSNLYQSSAMPVTKINQIEDMLADRGYGEKDMFLAKHFRFKKDESGARNMREVTKTEVARAGMNIERSHGVTVDNHDRDIYSEQYFHFVSYDTTVTKERCQQFVEGYETYVKNYQGPPK